jgi:hypothetical protein
VILNVDGKIKVMRKKRRRKGLLEKNDFTSGLFQTPPHGDDD